MCTDTFFFTYRLHVPNIRSQELYEQEKRHRHGGAFLFDFVLPLITALSIKYKVY